MFICARTVGLAFGLTQLSTPFAQASVTFDWATIGHAGNDADSTGFGAVANEFRMATTEVTIGQYTEFLNAVAVTDNFGGTDPHLYNTNMTDSFAGITRSGSPGSFTYSVIPGRENNPVVYTSFIDAMRFTNWLHNGQGSGGTESGVYSIADGKTENRAAGARYFLPNENEWYKGAYHQPASQGGDSDNYWLYPTSSNSIPIGGVDANILPGGPSTSIVVGSFSANYYGLFDMGGNVWEWSSGHPTVDLRGFHGGSWGSNESRLLSSFRDAVDGIPFAEFKGAGFRVASPVPGPAPGAIVILGGAILLRRRRG